ncbi:MAG: hypothetical protein PHU85_06610, partial [Phycisphaerae bacterium]|nr:hypothetical protein [Phycisphaerae bacterium]
MHSAFPVLAQTRPDATVSATPGLSGQWAVQQWAPLRLTFRDPGPVKFVDIRSADAGPTFRATAAPAPSGESFVDVAVYAQLASTQWVVRLTRPDGSCAEFPLELSVSFAGYAGSLDGPTGPTESAYRDPPRQMRIAAARTARADMKDLDAAAFLATGRAMQVLGPVGAHDVQLVDTFAPPDDSPLIWPQTETPPFYRHVWTEDAARSTGRPITLALVILLAGCLGIVAIGLVFRRRPIGAAVLAVLGLALTAIAIWPTQPRQLQARAELIIHGGSLADGYLAVPVRRQEWQCVAAYRGGELSIQPIRAAGGAADRPTPRLIVTDAADRPDVILPASFWCDKNARVLLNLERGQRRAFTSIEYFIDTGTMRLADGRIAWQNWRAPISAAYLVCDSRATPLPAIDGADGEIAVPAGGEIAWDTVYAPDAGDSLDVRLAKRMLEYWTTSVVHGGRRWVVGFEPRRARVTAGAIDLPAMYAIDLG